MSGTRTAGILLILLCTGCYGCAPIQGISIYGEIPPPEARDQAPILADNPPPPVRHIRHHYRYYPDAGVYRDEARGLYFYPSNGSWIASATLPREIFIRLGEPVPVDMDSDRPYTEYEHHRAQYPPGWVMRHENERRRAEERERIELEKEKAADAARHADERRKAAEAARLDQEKKNQAEQDQLDRERKRLADQELLDREKRDLAERENLDRDRRDRDRERESREAQGPPPPVRDRDMADNRRQGPPLQDHSRRARFSYRYYPDSSVYFDEGRKIYFFLVNGAWKSAPALPVALSMRLGRAVTIETDSDRPYTEYDRHRALYPPGRDSMRRDR